MEDQNISEAVWYYSLHLKMLEIRLNYIKKSKNITPLQIDRFDVTNKKIKSAIDGVISLIKKDEQRRLAKQYLNESEEKFIRHSSITEELFRITDENLLDELLGVIDDFLIKKYNDNT